MMLLKQLVRIAVLIGGAVAYFARPWSCGRALELFSPQDDVPYANFDYHGFGAMVGWLLAVAFSPFVVWLARYIVSPPFQGAEANAFRPSTPVALGSFLVALAIGAPTFTQIAYLVGLPIALTKPIIASTLIWAALVLAFWIKAIRRADAPCVLREVRRKALLLAALITVPKVLIAGSWLFRAV